MKIKFNRDGYSPELGTFTRGEIRDIPIEIGRVFISRGVAVAVETIEEKKGKNREVKGNG